MKLLSFHHQDRETWGAVVGDGVVDLGAARPHQATLADYIASGDYLDAARHVQGLPIAAKLAGLSYLPVIPRPEKIICAVRNYMDHHQ
ncbi:MAG: 5-carboxymethyl-2-hydroxymuconate isomerase, partial [Comamonadaceae bacterium]